MINLPELQHFLDKGIVQVKERDNTLFDIAGFPHYENVISNVYAYFLDPAKDHGLGSLFLDALQDLIQTSYTFSSLKIMRECTSNNGGRIDLVIQEERNPTDQTEAIDGPVILIENKMYHDQLNDFEDYYNTFQAKNKKGVLLTIEKTPSKHTAFVNITHEQLIDAAFKNIGQLVLNVPYRTIFILNEFSKNLKNFTMKHEVSGYYEFYQKNRIAVQQVEKLMGELETHMWDQIDEVPKLLTDLNLKLSSKYSSVFRCYKENENDPVFFIVSPNIFDEEKPFLTIVVQLNNVGISRLKEISEIAFTPEEKEYITKKAVTSTIWHHYAGKEFPLSHADFENLSEFIRNKIESTPLTGIYNKVKDRLSIKLN